MVCCLRMEGNMPTVKKIQKRDIPKALRIAKSRYLKKMTDKEILTSPEMAEYLTNLAQGVTGVYDKTTRVNLMYDETSELVACMNKDLITLNIANDLVRFYGHLHQKIMCAAGLVFHECAHKKYLNLDLLENFNDERIKGMWPYSVPECDPYVLDEIEGYYKKFGKIVSQIVSKIAWDINNILADVHDENALAQECPGFPAKALVYPQVAMYESIPVFEDEIKKEMTKTEKLAFLFALLLRYARFHDVKIYTENCWENEFVLKLVECIDHIENGIEEDDISKRQASVNQLIIACWPYIKEVVEEVKETCDKMKDSSSDSSSYDEKREMSSILEEILDALEKSAEKTKSTVPTEIKPPPTSSKKDKGAGKKSTRTPSPSESDSDKEKTEKGKKKPEGEKESKDGGKPKHEEVPEEGEGKTEDGEKTEGEKTEDGKGAIKSKTEEAEERLKTASKLAPKVDDKDDSSAEKFAEKLKDEITERKAEEEEERKRVSELSAEIESVNARGHKGIRTYLKRKITVSKEMVEEYNVIARDLLPVSKAIQRQIQQVLKDRREGGKLYGEIYGKRFEDRSIARIDGRYFSKTKLPTETPRLAVAVLVDESGSMSGPREIAAQKMAILCEDFTRGLKIPTLICGHSTVGGGTFALYSYVEFDKIDRKDKYRLVDIHARSQNRDGLALKIMCERLIKRPEEIKLLIVISDGQPADYGYGGPLAEKEMQEICREYRKKGITIFAAAIGNDKENIKRIYKEGFLDISDLNKLPKSMVTLIKKHIKY